MLYQIAVHVQPVLWLVMMGYFSYVTFRILQAWIFNNITVRTSRLAVHMQWKNLGCILHHIVWRQIQQQLCHQVLDRLHCLCLITMQVLQDTFSIEGYSSHQCSIPCFLIKVRHCIMEFSVLRQDTLHKTLFPQQTLTVMVMQSLPLG